MENKMLFFLLKIAIIYLFIFLKSKLLILEN